MNENNNIVSQTLYRKYRPKNFDDILGQGNIVISLQNSIKNKSITHAYLFSGGRGSGKTTIARIFAKDVGVDKSDIYEIDAASNRGIEQIRQLRDGINILPMFSEYKVYIIDEVHMLTKEAFNALLKTLEEPPEHVIFILATTEKHKVLDTVISRCQSFEFEKGSLEELSKLVEKVSKLEKINIDKESINFIANAGGGSFRDTLSQLQKTISIFGSNIKISEIEKVLKNSSQTLEGNFIKALSGKKIDELLLVYKKVMDSGIDIEFFVFSILEKVRNILLIKNSSEFDKLLSEKFEKKDLEELKKLKGINSLLLKNLLEIVDKMKKSQNPEIAFEIFMLDLIK